MSSNAIKVYLLLFRVSVCVGDTYYLKCAKKKKKSQGTVNKAINTTERRVTSPEHSEGIYGQVTRP